MATRREKVILELEDNFTTGMARAAAATALLDRNLSSLSGDAVKSTRVELDRTAIAARKTSTELDRTGTTARRSGAEIDRMSGRLRLLTDAALTLGPALIPIGAAGVPALMALTAGFGAAAGAAGVALIAFNGVGDGIKALNEYQLEPTTANMQKLNEQMAALGPAGAAFVRYLDDLEPQLRGLQQITRAGLFPGVQEGINSLLTMLPQVRAILFNLSTAFGGLAASAGAALSGEGFAGFFDYLENQAGPLLTSFGQTLGNVTKGFASLVVAFAPLTGSFAAGMERMSAAFADWAAGVSQTQGFADFVAYVQRTGPQVVELLGAMGTAFIGILTAAAPVGEALLPTLTALARILGTIAASPIGPPLFTAVAALLAVNRAATLASTGFAKLQASATGASTAASKFGAGISFVAILTGIGAVNAAFNNLSASIDEADLSRNLEALSRGESVDNLAKLGDWISQATSSLSGFNDKLSDIFTLGFDTSALEKAQEEIEKVDQVLAQMVESGQAETAASAFDQIAEAAARQGVSIEDVKGEFDAYQTALRNAAPAAEAAAQATEDYAAANDSAARVLRLTRAQVNGLNEAMEEQVSTALSAFDAVTRYAEALEAARKRAKQSDAGLDAATKAGRENRDVLSQLAAAWNNQGAAIRNNMGKWREARAEFIAVAREMGATGQQARNLADRILEIPRQRQIDIKLYGSEEAANQLERIRQQVMSIPREWRTTYYVNQVNSISRRFDPTIAPDIQRAGGGTVPGPRLPYRDKVLAYLAPGEEVITNRNGEADRFRRDRASGRIPAYAEGGTVGVQSLMFGGTAGVGSAISLTSAQAAASLLTGLGRLGEREIQLRQRQLDKLEQLAQRQVDAAARRLDEEREALKDLRDARRDFMRSVTSQFRSDVFGGNVDLEQAYKSGLIGGDAINPQLYAFMQQQQASGANTSTNVLDYLDSFFASLSPSALAAIQAQASVAQITRDANSASSFENVLEQLRAMGLTGGAFNELAQSGNLALAQQYAAMGPDFIKTLMEQYRGRNEELRELGAAVTSLNGMTADVREQVRVSRRAARSAERAEAELREIKQINRQMERRLAAIEKDGPERTGAAAAKGTDSRVSHGMMQGA